MNYFSCIFVSELVDFVRLNDEGCMRGFCFDG